MDWWVSLAPRKLAIYPHDYPSSMASTVSTRLHGIYEPVATCRDEEESADPLQFSHNRTNDTTLNKVLASKMRTPRASANLSRGSSLGDMPLSLCIQISIGSLTVQVIRCHATEPKVEGFRLGSEPFSFSRPTITGTGTTCHTTSGEASSLGPQGGSKP